MIKTKMLAAFLVTSAVLYAGTSTENNDIDETTIFDKLRTLSNELDSKNHRLILILDNLDAFLYIVN